MFQLNHNMYSITAYAFSDMLNHPTSEKKLVRNSAVPIKFTSAGALFLKVKVQFN